MNIECAQEIASIIAVGSRGIVIVIATLAATMSIFLGWKLCKESGIQRTEGQATFSGLKVKLISAGPGVFFAAFGMWLLVSLVNRPLQLERATEARKEAFSNSSTLDNLESKPRNSRTAFLPIAENKGVGALADCILRKDKLAFIDGGQKTSIVEIRTAIDLAIRALQDASKTYPEGDDRARASANGIRTLRVLGNSLEK
jgi:hypothetical protein